MFVTIDGLDGFMLTDQILMVPVYVGHWRGEAYATIHTYGVHVHRSLHDALRWVTARAELSAELREGRHFSYPEACRQCGGSAHGCRERCGENAKQDTYPV